MDIRIQKGSMKYLNDCEEALLSSELGERYFTGGIAKKAILEGLNEENLYIALNSDECVGFVWYLPNGAFHSFPYIHIISVKKEYRGRGIGKKMISFFEESAFENEDKIFLLVADFNSNAKRLYERIGYRQVGEIPSLYRKGITECLMMKEREK